MQLDQSLSQSLSRWNLLDSAFYQAWSAGELPVDALATYAHEYGAFITTIADGWAAHGDDAVAAEEREHVELWRAFAKSLGTDIGAASTPAVAELVEVARRSFSDPVASLGALYAFEAQQPATSASKLEGLRAHYDLGAEAEVYFDVHKDDLDEPALLLERMRALPAVDQERAAAACEQTARALRLALDGLYAGCVAQA
ncbi:MAG: hypothetical protein GC160_06120 [Acidobacteria bacterium]|nr:hypothetical protein [Acidobacteriota bacterium]